MFTFLCGLSAAAHVLTRGAADKGQSVRNWHIEPVGIKPALPPPAIEKGRTRGMQTIETPLIFGLSDSSDIRGGLLAYVFSFSRLVTGFTVTRPLLPLLRAGVKYVFMPACLRVAYWEHFGAVVMPVIRFLRCLSRFAGRLSGVWLMRRHRPIRRFY